MRKPAATHEDLRRQHEVKTSSNRSFGVVFAVVFLIVALLPLLSGGDVRLWSLAVAAAFLALALAAPRLLAPLNWAWTRVGLVLHHVVNPIVMGVLFFLVVTPVGLIMRLSGKDPLRLRLERGSGSYWIERRPPGPAPETMKNQF